MLFLYIFYYLLFLDMQNVKDLVYLPKECSFIINLRPKVQKNIFFVILFFCFCFIILQHELLKALFCYLIAVFPLCMSVHFLQILFVHIDLLTDFQVCNIVGSVYSDAYLPGAHLFLWRGSGLSFENPLQADKVWPLTQFFLFDLICPTGKLI